MLDNVINFILCEYPIQTHCSQTVHSYSEVSVFFDFCRTDALEPASFVHDDRPSTCLQTLETLTAVWLIDSV